MSIAHSCFWQYARKYLKEKSTLKCAFRLTLNVYYFETLLGNETSLDFSPESESK